MRRMSTSLPCASFAIGQVNSETLSPSRSRNPSGMRSEEHTSELQSRQYLVCRLLLEKKQIHTRPAAEARGRARAGAAHLGGEAPRPAESRRRVPRARGELADTVRA